MDCQSATHLAKKLNHLLISEKISLDASAFFNEYLAFSEDLSRRYLKFQRSAWVKAKVVRLCFSLLYGFLDLVLAA